MSRPCPTPRCPNLQPCSTHIRKPFANARRALDLYGSTRWRAIRKAHLEQEPNCRECGRKASVVDHITPHRGNLDLFYNGPLQSLCWPHSNRKTGRETREGAHV